MTTQNPSQDSVTLWRVEVVRDRSFRVRRTVRNAFGVIPALRALLPDTLDREQFVAIYLDARLRAIGAQVVSVGTLTASLVHPREVLKPAILCNAAGIVVAHNHPSGNPEPSPEDYAITERLRDACAVMGIDLLDSVVVAGRKMVSLRKQLGM